MKNYKRFLLLLPAFIFVGCIGTKTSLVVQPTQTLSNTQIVLPSPTTTSSLPTWCKDINQENGVPFSNDLKKSHILYKAVILYETNDQTWQFSLKDNSNKLSMDVFPYPETKDGQYDVNGFSLNSADEQHIAIWGHWYEESNPDGTYSLIIRDKESGQDVDVFRTSPAENIQGAWAPDGNYFVFTSYKNSDEHNPQYYSLVYAVNANGTGLRQLTERMKLETLERPRWSPDGNKIAIPVWGRDGGMHILIINFQSGAVTRYKVSPIIRLSSTNYGGWMEQNEMVWSPDSQWFAYISGYYEHDGIEILNTENGEIYCIDNEKFIGADYLGVDKVIWVYDNP